MMNDSNTIFRLNRCDVQLHSDNSTDEINDSYIELQIYMNRTFESCVSKPIVRVATHLEIRENGGYEKSGKFMKNCQKSGENKIVFADIFENIDIARFIFVFDNSYQC